MPYVSLCAKIMYYPIKRTEQLCESLSPFHRTGNQGSRKLISITNNTRSCNSNPGLPDSKAYTLQHSPLSENLPQLAPQYSVRKDLCYWPRIKHSSPDIPSHQQTLKRKIFKLKFYFCIKPSLKLKKKNLSILEKAGETNSLHRFTRPDL